MYKLFRKLKINYLIFSFNYRHYYYLCTAIKKLSNWREIKEYEPFQRVLIQLFKLNAGKSFDDTL